MSAHWLKYRGSINGSTLVSGLASRTSPTLLGRASKEVSGVAVAEAELATVVDTDADDQFHLHVGHLHVGTGPVVGARLGDAAGDEPRTMSAPLPHGSQHASRADAGDADGVLVGAGSIDEERRDVVLKVLADPRHVEDRGDPQLLQVRTGADTRRHQDLGCAERTGSVGAVMR